MRRHWAVWIALVCFVASSVLVGNVFFELSSADRIVYALDDPYIHMAIARHLVEDSVYGVTPYEFSSSSSSPLYAFLLAAANSVFGVREIIPLVVNVLSALVLFVIAHRILRAHLHSQLAILGCLLGVLYLAPVIPVVFTGMEHVLQMALTLPFLYACATRIAADEDNLSYWPVYLLCPLVTTVRYEGVFAVLVVCGLLALRGRFRPALVLSCLGALPLGGIALVSIANGSFALPNPVLIHGNPAIGSLGEAILYPFRGLVGLGQAPHLLALVIASSVLFFLALPRKGLWDRTQIFQVSFVATALIHEQFARNGWFYRYEAYLVALGVIAVFLASRGAVPQRRHAIAVVLCLGLAVPLVVRGATSLRQTPRAMTNIYHQQYQMGRFLREHYEGQPVAANDIGAINYLADIRNLDLVGLGSMDVLRIKAQASFDSARIAELTKRKGIRIAIVYESWFKGSKALPAEWIKVGGWTIPDNVVCAEDTVAFFATSPAEARILRRNLAGFSRSLPDAVVESGSYVAPGPRVGPTG